MRKLGVWIIFLILLASSVFAVSYDFQQEGNGIVINYKDQIYIKQNEYYNFRVHVFNDSVGGALLTDSTTTCTIHLYNQSGNHLIQSGGGMTYNNADFGIEIDGKNFSTTGHYVYTVGCSNAQGWGFISGHFVVTEDRLSDEVLDSSSGISVFLFMMFITIGMFALGFWGKFLKESPIINLVIVRSCFLLGLLMSMFTSGVLMRISDVTNLGLNQEMAMFIFIFGWAMYVSMIYLVVKTIFDIYSMYDKMLLNKRMGENDD